MKRLFVAVLMCSYVGASFGANLHSTLESKANLAPSVNNVEAGVKTPVKSTLKTLFASSGQKMAEGERIRQPATERASVDTDQLQSIIDKLPASDQKVLSAVRTQIATWPQEIFEEVSSYREFVINARKVAQQKYDLLSQEAKSALESEKQLKTQLSPETVQKLEALDASVLN